MISTVIVLLSILDFPFKPDATGAFEFVFFVTVTIVGVMNRNALACRRLGNWNIVVAIVYLRCLPSSLAFVWFLVGWLPVVARNLKPTRVAPPLI